MAETWKGWMPEGTARKGVRNFEYVAASPERLNAATGLRRRLEAVPVLVTPIEDESLPHPGDGRNWIYYGTRVEEILTPPVGPEGIVHLIWAGGRQGSMRAVDLDRERKPETEHRPWCKRERCKPETTDAGCWCRCPDPRSGTERRKNKSKAVRAHGVSYYVRDGDFSQLHVGTRSGTVRRSP